MKKTIYIIITFVMISTGVFAQIDRSHPPKPGPSPKISLDNPKEFKLNNGMTVLVVENHKLPKVTYSLRMDRKPMIEGKKSGVSDILAKMLGNGTTSIPKDKFNEEVDYMGAFLNFRDKSAYASSLTQYSDRILHLMADASMNPLFTQEELDKEREKMINGLKASEKDVATIASHVSDALVYGKHHPYGEFTTEETLKNISLKDIQDLYKANFNPAKSYLVVIGDVKFNEIKKKVHQYFGHWKKANLKDVQVPKASPNVARTEIDFVDMPNAVQSNVSLTNSVKLQKKDPDFHASLIANEILGGGFNGYLNMNLREKHGYTYGSYSGLRSDKYIGRFRTTAKVRNAVTDSTIMQTIKEIKRIRTEPVDPEVLKNTKAKYTGKFVLSLENPRTIADFALDIKLQDLPSDFYSTYLDKINKVTPDDIQKVANKYFKVDHARIVVVGKGSDVIKNLEKTGIPIKYFDKYANPVKKPDLTVALPKGVTSKTIMENFLDAIGGKDNIDKIKTLWVKAEAEIQPGMLMSMEMKKKDGDKFVQVVSAMGNVMSKQVINGNTGYIEAQGKRKEMTAKELNDAKDQIVMISEEAYMDKDLKIEGIEEVNGEKAYRVKKTDTLTSFYSVDSGLKLKDIQINNGVPIETIFTDYKAVKGVKFPFMLKQSVGPQKFDFITKEIKINEGVTDADFK